VTRHPFDPISFTVGVLALLAGAVVLAGGTLTDEARLLLPAGLIALGVALLAKVLDRPDRTPPRSAEPAAGRAADGPSTQPVDVWLDPWPDLPSAPDPSARDLSGNAATDPSHRPAGERDADPSTDSAGDPPGYPGADPSTDPAGEPSGEPVTDPDDRAG
jgi:hypothetical protein